jgi:hypothetical protein
MTFKPGMITLEVANGREFIMELVRPTGDGRGGWQVLYWNPDMMIHKGFYRYEEDMLPENPDHKYFSAYGKELPGHRVFVLWENK